MVGIAAKTLKNRPRGEVATVVPISGRVDRPQVGRWEAVGGLLRNAFVQAIHPGFDPQRSPTGGSPPAHEDGTGRDRVGREAGPTPTIDTPK